LEYKFNREIVERIVRQLKKNGVQYFIVVPEEDVDNLLEERVRRANAKTSALPRIFVSVHSNAAPAPLGKWADPNISGIETWYYHNNARGRKVASVFQKHLVAATGWKNRFIKSRPTNQFYVLRNTNMTAVLTENGFYNNKAQCMELMKEDTKDKIAAAHVDAIMEIEKHGI
jgi:N-acetylmuramoyl-L-alanine amidase